jgi:hypothetical protein
MPHIPKTTQDVSMMTPPSPMTVWGPLWSAIFPATGAKSTPTAPTTPNRPAISAYFEIDFLGVGTSSDYLVTNDWPPRLRNGYITYDNDNWGFHLLAGQDWSLAMPDKDGIKPREENIPLTINANYLVGYDFTRNWQVRAVKDFGPTLAAAVSIENPATSLAPGIPTTVNGLAVNTFNTGTGGFLNDVPVTPNTFPDIIEKISWDPGWGHYELLGMQRFFSDNTLCETAAPNGCVPGTTSEKTTFGAGVGAAFLLPVVPKYLDLMGVGCLDEASVATEPGACPT